MRIRNPVKVCRSSEAGSSNGELLIANTARLSFKKDIARQTPDALIDRGPQFERGWRRGRRCVSEIRSGSAGQYPCERCPLRPLEMFRTFETEELAFISASRGANSSVDKGATVLVEGSHSAHLYTVLFGLGFRYKLMADGRRQILNYLLPGDLIGLQGSLMGEMQHSVEALSPMLLCVFEREQLHELYRNHPGLAYDITWIASREEQMLDENLLSIGRRTALERAAYLIAFVAPGRLPADSRQPRCAAADHAAAHRRHARPVAGPHQQDDPQADRAQADRWRDGGCEVVDIDGLMEVAGWEGLWARAAARLSDGTAGQCREGAAGKTDSRLRSLDAGR